MAEVEHSGSGDNVLGSKIGRQINVHGGDYQEHHHYPDNRRIRKHLTTPPFYPDTFLGREKDFADVHSMLHSGNRFLLLMSGEGGIGKTSLASVYYHGWSEDYRHLAWILCQQTITSAVLGLKDTLGLELEPRMPDQEKVKRVVDSLAQLDGKCLLVIDNANEMTDAEYQLLRKLPNFHLLLTTRLHGFQGAAVLRLEGLPYGEAHQLFTKHYPNHDPAEDDLFQRVHQAIWGNTLVIELIAKNLQTLNPIKGRAHYSLSKLLEELENGGLLHLSKQALLSTDYQADDEAKRRTIQEIVEAMYDLQSLTEAEQALMSIFAVLPTERIAFETLDNLLQKKLDEQELAILPQLETMAQTAEGMEMLRAFLKENGKEIDIEALSAEIEKVKSNPYADLDQTLVSLAQKGWLDHQEATSAFRVSPVVQEVTRHKNQARLFADCVPLIDALNKKLAYDGVHITGSSYEDAAYYARLGEAIVPCFAAPEDKVGILCERLGNFHQILGDLNRALEFFERSLAVDKALDEAFPRNVDFKNNLAISYSKLGETHTALGDLNRALECYTEYHRLEKELHEAFPSNVEFKNNLAASYSKLGVTHTALGDLTQALECYMDFNRLEKELHEAFPSNVDFKNGLAISYSKLGETHTALGDLTRALECYTDYHRLEKELHEAFPSNVGFKNNLAISYCFLGNTHTALGDLNQALECYTDYHRLEKELHEAFPTNVEFKNSLAISYWNLGDLSRKLQDIGTARKHFTQAQQLWTELVEASPEAVEYQRNLAWVQRNLDELGNTNTKGY